jgi:hypothetical protein
MDNPKRWDKPQFWKVEFQKPAMGFVDLPGATGSAGVLAGFYCRDGSTPKEQYPLAAPLILNEDASA